MGGTGHEMGIRLEWCWKIFPKTQDDEWNNNLRLLGYSGSIQSSYAKLIMFFSVLSFVLLILSLLQRDKFLLFRIGWFVEFIHTDQEMRTFWKHWLCKFFHVVSRLIGKLILAPILKNNTKISFANNTNNYNPR